MAALALSFSAGAIAGGRVPRWSCGAASGAFHLTSNSFSRWKYRQVDCFIAASEAIRQMLVADGVPGGAHGHGPRGHRRRARDAAPRRSTCTRRSGCRTTRRSSATSRRSCRTRASVISIEAAHLVVQRGARRALRHPRRGRAARARSSDRSREHHLEKHVLLPGSAPMCSAASRASICSR